MRVLKATFIKVVSIGSKVYNSIDVRQDDFVRRQMSITMKPGQHLILAHQDRDGSRVCTIVPLSNVSHCEVDEVVKA